MEDSIQLKVTGHLNIKDKDTGEIIVDKDNAVHYGNISTQIALAMTGAPTSFINYLAFGDGAASINQAGIIIYRSPNIGINKNSNATLYGTKLVAHLENNAEAVTLNTGDVTVPGIDIINFEDIVIVIDLPATGTLVNTQPTLAEGAGVSEDFVFNEIGLFSGKEFEPALDFSDLTAANISVNAFTSDETVRMLTHVIFHPVQKAANRTFTITYTLRIQMGD